MASNIQARLEVQGYVNNQLVKRSRWVEFPCSEERLMQEVIRLAEDTEGEPSLPSYAKRMARIVEWDVPSFFENKFDVEAEDWALDLAKVNDLAEDIKNINENDFEIVRAMVDDGGWTIDEALSVVRNGEFTDFRDDDEEDIVKHFLEEDCGRRVPEYILDNVDWDGAFEDLKDDRCGTFLETDNGWVYID